MPTMKLALPTGVNAALRRVAASDPVRARSAGNTARRARCGGGDGPPPKGMDRRIVRRLLDGLPAVLGMRASEVRILDLLVGRTRPADWKAGTPISYLGNAEIRDTTGFSDRTISRSIARLERFGVLTRAYTGSGHRKCHRDKAERIVAVSGIDLSPLITRHDEWKTAVEEHRAHARERRARLTAVINRRRVLRDSLAELEGCGIDDEVRDGLELAAHAIPDGKTQTRELRCLSDAEIAAIERRLDALTTRYERMCACLFSINKGTVMGDSDVTHHTRTQPQPNPSSTTGCADAQSSFDTPPAVSDRKKGNRGRPRVSAALLSRAFPSFWEKVPDGCEMSPALLQMVAQDCLYDLGLREAVWSEWTGKVDPTVLSLAIALTYERATTDGPNRMADPARAGGYFVSCARRALEGSFFVEASIHACARRNDIAEEVDDLI